MQVMRSGEVKQVRAPRRQAACGTIDAISAPFARGQSAVGEHHDMVVRVREGAQCEETVAAKRVGKMIMAVDEPRSARKPPQRLFERGVIAFV